MINSDKIQTNSWFVIANPTAGNKRFSKIWKEIELLLSEYKFNYHFAFTHYAKHEVVLVGEAIKNGFRNIISVGGDGTLHHVVNAIMLQRYVKTSDITIGVIPVGTGNDWIKTYNIPNNSRKAIEIIHQQKKVTQDIGVLKFDDKTEYFSNVAGIGYDAFVVQKLKKLKKLGSLSYTFAGLFGILKYRKSEFKILINNQIIQTNCLLTVFGICKYSGGGMQFTKDVNPSNGLLDITIVSNFTLWDLIINLPKLYSGKIVYHKKVQTFKTESLEIIPKDKKNLFSSRWRVVGRRKARGFYH